MNINHTKYLNHVNEFKVLRDNNQIQKNRKYTVPIIIKILHYVNLIKFNHKKQ